MSTLRLTALGMLMTAAVWTGSASCDKPGGGGFPAPRGVANTGRTSETIVFEDHTGDEWPVHAALTTWATVIKASGAALVVEYGQCRDDARCVRVDAADHGPWDGVLGETRSGWSGASITLNSHYRNTAQQYRAIACHEIGHALGLSHNPSHGSCLFATVDDAPATTPDRADQDALAARWPAVGGQS